MTDYVRMAEDHQPLGEQVTLPEGFIPLSRELSPKQQDTLKGFISMGKSIIAGADSPEDAMEKVKNLAYNTLLEI